MMDTGTIRLVRWAVAALALTVASARLNTDAPFLHQVWQNSGLFVEMLLILLGVMFFWMMLNTIEHVAQCGDMTWRSTSFVRESSSLLRQNNWQELLATTKKYPRSHVACVFAAALAAFHAARERVTLGEAVEVARRAGCVAANKVREQYRAGTGGLKAIALTAPLVGLVGTTVRLLHWFDAYVGNKYWGVLLIFGLTAEALVPMLVGLFVGIVAVWWFNWRIARVEKLDTQMKVASLKLLNGLKISCRS